jgi:hypothetical protein
MISKPVPKATQGGTDHGGFYTAAGWGVADIATFPWLLWVLIVSILMIRKG